jgi:hypothetical protein
MSKMIKKSDSEWTADDQLEYAKKRVAKLKARLSELKENWHPWLKDEQPDRYRKINNTKASLRRWLRDHPSIDPELLASITR